MKAELKILLVGVIAALGLMVLFTNVSITGMQFTRIPTISVPTPTLPTTIPQVQQRTVVQLTGIAGLIIQTDDTGKITPETCPAGYGHPGGMPTLGAFKTSPGLMDGTIEGVSASGKTTDSGWIELCAKDKGLVTVILQDDCAGITHSPAVQEECPAGYALIGKFQAGPGKEGCKEGMGSNAYVTSGKLIPSAMIGICAKGATPPKEGPLAPRYKGTVHLILSDACQNVPAGAPVALEQCSVCVRQDVGICDRCASPYVTGDGWLSDQILKFRLTQKADSAKITVFGGEQIQCALYRDGTRSVILDQFTDNNCQATYSATLPALEPGAYTIRCGARGEGNNKIWRFKANSFQLNFGVVPAAVMTGVVT